MKKTRGGAETEGLDQLPETEPDARATKYAEPRPPGARLQLLREQAEKAEVHLKPVLEMLDGYAEAAAARGDGDTVALVKVTKLAAARQDHASLARNLQRIQAAAKPVPEVSADQRETLIRAVVSLGREAVEEAMRRVKANARSK